MVEINTRATTEARPSTIRILHSHYSLPAWAPAGTGPGDFLRFRLKIVTILLTEPLLSLVRERVNSPGTDDQIRLNVLRCSAGLVLPLGGDYPEFTDNSVGKNRKEVPWLLASE